jgi:integrase
MAKAKRERTRYPAVYKVGERYEWISRRSNTRGTADALQDAYEAKLRADASGQVVTASARGPFGAYAREWIDNYQGRTARGFSEGTRRRYRESLELWAIPYFDTKRKRRFAAVEKPDVRAFVAWLSNPDRTDATGKPYGPRLEPATIRSTLAPVRAMYADAIEDGTLTKANPASVRINVQRELDADDKRRAFTPDEFVAVLEAAPSDDDRLLFDALAETGARWGEACEWRGRDLKTTPDGPRLCVHRAYSNKTKGDDGMGVVKLPKSSYGRREIPITPELSRRLWRLRARPMNCCSPRRRAAGWSTPTRAAVSCCPRSTRRA